MAEPWREDPRMPRRTAGRGLGFLLSRSGLGLGAGVMLAAALLFGLLPSLDLYVAALFYDGGGHFVGRGPWGEGVRRALYLVPFAILLICAALYGLRRAGWDPRWSPRGRELAFLVISFALGPGLLVNVLLKDHSHRPRPAQVVDFGGTMPFRPFYRFDGGCPRNCSFVSGEGSSAFWSLAPALLVPAAAQPWALAAAVCLGVGTGLLRMAFGGHFLSDTVFAALLTWLVIAFVARIALGRR